MNSSPPLHAAAIPLLHDYLRASAALHPDKVAVTCEGRVTTYRELAARANALAHALVRRGVTRGDRVVVYAGNSIDTIIAFWATLEASAVVSIINPLTRADKLTYLLNDSGATVLIAEAGLAPVFLEAAPKAALLRSVLVSGCGADDSPFRSLPGFARFDEAIDAEVADTALPRLCIDIDLAALIYTSGSTGEAKGVMLTHRNMTAAATSVSTYLELREDEVILGVLPLAFDYGLYQMIMSVRAGARLVLEKSFAFPISVLKRVVDEGVTAFPGVPTMFATMSDMRNLDQFDLSRVRLVTNTAAALHVKHILMLRHLFPQARIYSMYGLTECKRCTFLPPAEIERRPTSVGIAIPNTELWLVNEHDQRVGPNEVGQLVIRGATVMRGYWGKPLETAKKLRPGPLPGELVLYTGDLCRLDEDGFLYFVGRMDDIIKSRGEKVAPKEVEDAIVSISGVKEAAVIGVSDEILGQAVKAYVVPLDGVQLDVQTIRRECQKRLEAFAVPRDIVIVEELPRGATGKVQKTGLS